MRRTNQESCYLCWLVMLLALTGCEGRTLYRQLQIRRPHPIQKKLTEIL